MLPELRLSPLHWLALIRLNAGSWQPDWPGLMICSPRPVWPFEENPAPVTGDQLAERARAAGLHQVRQPFTEDVPAAPGWSFRLPTLRRHAQVSAPIAIITTTRPLKITDDWWRLAVTHGARCRLLVAVCVSFDDDPADAVNSADVLNAAADDARVYGATIAVEF